MQRRHTPSAEPGWIFAEVDDRLTAPSCSATFLQARRSQSQLDRHLDFWRRRHPDLDLPSVGMQGTVVNFLAKNADAIQLIIGGRKHRGEVNELVGPAGSATLHDASCSMLVCDLQRPL